jgi:hypothetical protein
LGIPLSDLKQIDDAFTEEEVWTTTKGLHLDNGLDSTDC